MVHILKIRLTTPILGSKRLRNDSVRRLNGTQDTIDIEHEIWLDRFEESARSLGAEVKRDLIQFSQGYKAPSKHLYRRVYNKTKFEMFEMLRTGTVITMELMINFHLYPEHTLENIREIFNTWGQYKGISQWGEKFGYGKFQVVDLYPKTLKQ